MTDWLAMKDCPLDGTFVDLLVGDDIPIKLAWYEIDTWMYCVNGRVIEIDENLYEPKGWKMSA